jgi:hypothetical protein
MSYDVCAIDPSLSTSIEHPLYNVSSEVSLIASFSYQRQITSTSSVTARLAYVA